MHDDDVISPVIQNQARWAKRTEDAIAFWNSWVVKFENKWGFNPMTGKKSEDA